MTNQPGLWGIVAIANQVNAQGNTFTEQALQEAAAKDNRLYYDPERKILWVKLRTFDDNFEPELKPEKGDDSGAR